MQIVFGKRKDAALFCYTVMFLAEWRQQAQTKEYCGDVILRRLFFCMDDAFRFRL